MTVNVDKFGKKSGVELNSLKAGMKASDIDEKNKAGKSVFDAIDTDGNGVIDENEISMFRKDIDSDGDNTISKKEADKYLKDKELKDVDKKDVLKFLAEMITDTENVKEVRVVEKNGKKVVQVTYNNGSVDLINDDKSYSHITTDENGNEITEEYTADRKPERKTVKAQNKDVTVTEYEQDGKTVKQEVKTIADSGEVTTTNYEEGKPVSKDVERGTTLTHYEVDSEGNAQKKSMIVNKDDPEKQKVTTYERNEDGTVTATTTDALNPKKKSVKTITNNEGNEVVTNEVVTDGDSRTERTPTENGFREVTTTPEGRIETEYNNDNHRIKQTKTINGTEYVIEYDGEGNTVGIVVQNGESISKIAKDFGTTTEQLIELNSDKIKGSGNRKFFNVGEKIKVPGELEADNPAITKRKSQEETRADYAKDEAIREQRRAEARARAEEQARVKEEAAARKKITFTEKKHKTFEELARGLFNGEGVKNPTKQQLQERIKQLKEANPNVKDGELIGKRITAPVAEAVHDRIATKEKKAAAAKQKAVENGKLQKESARQIADELIKATKGLNDEKAIKKALAKIDNPAELKEVERLLEAKGYKRDQYYSPLEKFMYKEMSGSKFYDKSFDDMEAIVKKYIQNGALSGEDAINAQARLAARLIIDGCDGLGTDVDETKEGIRLIKTPKSTGNAAVDKANAKKVYDRVNNIIKNHKSFGASFKGLKDYLEGDLWASEIKYLDGILAENNAIQGKQKSQAVKDLVQEAVEGAGTDIEYLKQAIKAIDSPEDRKAIEKELEAYCKKKGIKPQIAGQSYLQAILYDECDTFLGVSTDHKEIRKFNEMLIAQGAYTPEEVAKLRAEQAALQILDGNFDGIEDAVKQIKDPQVYAQMNALIATKGKNKGYTDIDSFMKKRGFSQAQCDLINAEFASKKLIDEAKSIEVASRLLQNSDFDTRAMGFKAIATGDIALAVDKALKAKGTSLAKITEQFNKEKAENKAKAAKWDGIAGVLGGFSPLGYIAEHISDQYNENTEVSDNLYVENKTPQNITPEQKAAYDMTVKTFEEQLNKMKQDYQDALDSQGVVSGALNAFCSVYNIGTTRDDIEARIKHDEETLKLLKLAADGKLAKVKDGKTESVSFEAVFKERASEFITANGTSISAIKNKYNPKEVTEFSTNKVEKVAKKAETIVAMDYAKDNISVCWNELNKGLNSKNNKELSVAICDTMEKLSQMSGKQLSLDAFGYKVSNGVIVDNSGNPVSAGKLNEIATQLKQGLSDVTKELMGVSIPANASDSDVTDILQDAYDDKMEAFKQEYRDAFGQQATDEMIENYMTTINSAKMVVNFGLLIGAAIAAPFTGGGSLAVFAATAGVSFGMNALEKSTDADGYTNSEWTADAEQAMWDGALTALGFKIGQAADVFAKGGQGFLQAAAQNNKWLAKLAANLPADKAAKVEATLAKLSQLSNVKAANISARIIDKNKALVTKFLPNANPATVEKATICLARMEALGFEETSDTIQSLLQTYCQEGQFNAEAFTQALIMSAIGNAAGHTFSAFGDVKNVGAVKNVDDVFKDIKGVDGKPLFTGAELDDLFKQNPGFKDLPTEELNGLKQKVAILAQLSNSDGSAIFTAADLKSLLGSQNLSAFTVDQLKAMSDKAMALKNLKGADGTPILKANELNNIVKAGGIYINDIPDDVFKRILLEPNANSILPGLLAELKSADDAKLINTLLSPVNGNTNLKFKISDIEDILESKHRSGITDFNGFTQEIMQQLSKELIITNPETMAVGILSNIKNDFQVSAFKDLIPNLSKSDMSYEQLAIVAGTLKRPEDVDVVKAFIKQAIDNADAGSSADVSSMISCYSALADLDNAKAQDFYLKVLSDISKSKVQADKIFDDVKRSMAKVKFGINIDSFDEGVIAAAIKSGDIDRIRFALNTTKTDISSDTPIMRYIQKHGNVPFDIDELKNIKTNSPIQENAFDIILDNNTAERFESSAIQEMINNVKSQKDLDNLKELLTMDVNGKPLNGHTIIESLKSGTVDPAAIAKMNPQNGVPFHHIQSGIAHIKGQYPISTDNAKRLVMLRASNKKRYDKIMNSGLLDLIKQGKVDESILKNIDENTFLSNRTLKDIRKLANGESLITTLKKQSDLSNISKFVENGDVCELNGKLFVNDNGKAVEIKLSKQKFEELFPPLSRVSFEQGYLGDCWLVSTLDNLMDLSDGRVALYKMFEQQGNDVLIKFPGVDKAVKFPNGQSIQSINGKQLLSPAQDAKGVLAHEGTAEGILMIEQAYAVHRLKEGARAYNANSSVTDISSFADVDVLMERARSGWQEEAINEIFGRKIATDHYGTDITNRQQMVDLIKKYAEDDKVLISFGTIDNGKVESELSKKYDIYSTHAYSIKGYDEKTGMVYITNPWHTSVVTEIPMYELTKYMRHVTVAKFDGVGSIPTPPPYRGSVASPARSAASSASPAHTSASAARAAENSSSAVHSADINAPKTQAVSASVLSGTEAKYIAKYTKNPQVTTEVFEALTEKIKNGEVPSREMLEVVTSDIAAKHGLKQIDLVRDFSKGTKVVSGWDNIEPMFRKSEAEVLQKIENGQGKALARFKEKRGLLSDTELKAKQEAQLKAQQEAELKAQKEVQLKAQREAELKARQEAELKTQKEAQRLQQETLEKFADKYPEVVADGAFRNSDSAAKLIDLMEKYDLQMGYSDFNSQSLYQEISAAGIRNDADMDTAFEMIKKRFHPDVIAEEARVKTLKQQYHFSNYETIVHSDKVITGLQKRMADGGKITMDDIDEMIQDNIPDVREFNNIKKRILEAPELQKGLNDNLHLDVYSNPKYSSVEDGIPNAMTILDNILADVKNGETPSLELIQKHIDRLDAKLRQDGKFVTVDSYYVLQDVLRNHDTLAPQCRGFVEDIIQGGFEPENIDLNGPRAVNSVTEKGAAEPSSSVRTSEGKGSSESSRTSRIEDGQSSAEPPRTSRVSDGKGAVEAATEPQAEPAASKSNGVFSRFKKFTKSIFGKSNEKLLTSTKVSDKISALRSINDMSGKPKFSERELEEFKRMLDFYVERGGAIADIPLNTMYAAACLPGVKSPNDLMKLLVGTSTDVDKREMLNFLINTNSVSVKEGMLTAAKSGVQVDAEFVKYLLGFTQHNSNNTGKAKLLETIFDKNGPIRPALGKLDRNTAVEISDILNNVKTADDVDNILGYIEKFKNSNPQGTKLDLSTLNTIIELENAAKAGRNIPHAAVTPFASPVLTKQDVLDRIKEMNKDPNIGVRYAQEYIEYFLEDFDWDNADRHLKNLKPLFENKISISQAKMKGWFSSAESAQAFEEINQLFSFYQRGSVRSDMDMLLTSMTPADWKNAKAIGLVDFARNNGLDPLELKKMCKLTKQEFKNLINSGLAAEGLGYASDNADINNLYLNIARRDYYRLRDLTYKDGQKTIEDAIKKAAGNDPAKIKELTLKMQKLSDKHLCEIMDWKKNIALDVEYYADNVDKIYDKVHKAIKDFDDSSFYNDFYKITRSITRENGHLVDKLLELDGIDQAKLHGAMTYADTPAKIHHLEVLIDKIKSGEETILAIPFVKNSEINPRIAQAKYAQLPKFEVGTKPESLLGSTKQGQTAAIGNKLYINDRGKMVELGISAEAYEKLFPPYKTLCIQQSDKTGDCYFLSGGLIAFMKNDYARVDLLKLLKQEGDDIVVTFPAYPNNPVRFKNGTIDLQNLHADTSTGNLMLEQAYAKARYAAANNISDASKVDADKAMEFIYGGYEDAVFNEILGTKDAKSYLKKSYSDSETLPQNVTFIGNKDMATLLEKYAGRDDVLLCGGSGVRDDGHLPEYGVTPNHAYCIEKIDSQNKTVTIINPYNSLYCMTLSYDQFTQYFASLAVKELKATA